MLVIQTGIGPLNKFIYKLCHIYHLIELWILPLPTHVPEVHNELSYIIVYIGSVSYILLRMYVPSGLICGSCD